MKPLVLCPGSSKQDVEIKGWVRSISQQSLHQRRHRRANIQYRRHLHLQSAGDKTQGVSKPICSLKKPLPSPNNTFGTRRNRIPVPFLVSPQETFPPRACPAKLSLARPEEQPSHVGERSERQIGFRNPTLIERRVLKRPKADLSSPNRLELFCTLKLLMFSAAVTSGRIQGNQHDVKMI